MKSLLEASGTSILSDIVNFFTSGKKNPLKRSSSEDKIYLGGSISNKTRQLVMTFPVLCDNSLPPSTASMINKANERNIVTMLQLLFSSISVSGRDGANILSQLHKNININSSMDDIIDSVDQFIDSNSNFLPGFFRESVREVDIKRAILEMKQEMKQQTKVFPVNSFSEVSLNEYEISNIHGQMIVTERKKPKKSDQNSSRDDDTSGASGIDILGMSDAEISGMGRRENEEVYNKAKTMQLRDQIERDREDDEMRRQYADSDRKRKEEMDQEKLRGERLRSDYQGLQNRDYEDNKQRAEELDKLKIQQIQRSLDYDAFTKQLLDTDVKKANEMVPTLMVVQFNEVDDKGKVISKKPFITGVKSRLISVDASDIVDRITVKKKTKINLLNFIRATTGEIKFFRDFLFCVDQAKIDAKNSVKKGEAAKMWKVLENRSSKNFHNKAKRSGNDASAITTLVINQETVNFIKKNYDFDLERIANAKMILDAYNLLGLIIADESIEVVKFLYAGNDLFEQQAYSYLNKEQADNSYKKIINLISKMNSGR